MRQYFRTETGGTNSSVNAFVNAISDSLKVGSTGAGYGGHIASLESWGKPDLAAQMQGQLQHNQATIDALAQSAGFSIESYCGNVVDTSARKNWLHVHQMNVAKQAGAIALEAATNPEEYIRGAKASMEAFDAIHAAKQFGYVADYTNGARAAALGILDNQVALEAFENNNLSAAMDYSVAFNFIAPVQEPFIEVLFKTIVMAPDQVAFFYEVSLDRFWDGAKHLVRDPKTGALNPARHLFEKHNLMDAIRRPSILRQDVLNVVPYYDEAAADAGDDFATEYKAQFMSPDIFDFGTRRVANIDIRTQPLRVGKEYNLLTVSSHPELLNGGTFDETDTLDSYIALDKLYMRVKEGDTADSFIEFSLDGLERRNFIKSIQGHGFDMDLKFKTTELVIDEKTRTLGDGALPEPLAGLVKAGYRARLLVEIVGTANVETSFFVLQHASVKLDRLVHVTEGKNGAKDIVRFVDPASKVAEDQDAMKKFTGFTVEYFYPYGNRTNRNLRTQGIMVDSDVFSAKIAIGVRSPIRLQRPVGSDREYPTVDKLINVLRARQTADAFYELFAYRDTLRRYVSSSLRDPNRVPDFVGLGKYFVKPHYDHIKVNLAELIKSSETRFNLENAREGLIGILQEAAARCMIESQWMIGATMLNGGKEVKPHFAICTGNYLPLLLSVKGDLRLLGANFDHTITTSMNEEMDDKIIMTLITPESEGFNPLGFGNTFYYPELITSISPHAQNGAIKDTVMVSPRYQHVCNLPIMIEVDVAGVKEFMETYNKYRVTLDEASAVQKAAEETGLAAAPQPGTGG